MSRSSVISCHVVAVAFAMTAAASVAAQTHEPTPPVARRVPKVDTLLGEVRVDPYFWLRDDKRSAPEVIDYLEAENRYSDAVMRHTEPLQQKLYAEMVGTHQGDRSVGAGVRGWSLVLHPDAEREAVPDLLSPPRQPQGAGGGVARRE